MRARGLKRAIYLKMDGTAFMSRPMRARGLKQRKSGYCNRSATVAPHAGAWIETEKTGRIIFYGSRRAPCGRVD